MTVHLRRFCLPMTHANETTLGRTLTRKWSLHPEKETDQDKRRDERRKDENLRNRKLEVYALAHTSLQFIQSIRHSTPILLHHDVRRLPTLPPSPPSIILQSSPMRMPDKHHACLKEIKSQNKKKTVLLVQGAVVDARISHRGPGTLD